MREELLYTGAGVIVAVGPGVSSVALGDPVVLSTGHQAYVVAPVSGVHRIPAGLPPREAAISYLCSWSVSALHLGRYRAAETVVIVGPGACGRVGGAGGESDGRAGSGAGRWRGRARWLEAAFGG